MTMPDPTPQRCPTPTTFGPTDPARPSMIPCSSLSDSIPILPLVDCLVTSYLQVTMWGQMLQRAGASPHSRRGAPHPDRYDGRMTEHPNLAPLARALERVGDRWMLL